MEIDYERQPEPAEEKNAQQQAAEAWDAIEAAGYEVISVDGVKLDVELD
ncbi:hypothetical protein [Streptomyces rectiverticillatus]|nr:hypothetical protein [Streptomyces rectiverticillatus]